MSSKKPFIIGLDLGSNSLGWSVIEIDKDKKPKTITKLGVRVFNPGIKDLETSNPATAASERRLARLARRQTDRRRMRKIKTEHVLKNAGLWPESDNRAVFCERIDHETVKKYIAEAVEPEQFVHVVPYYLRARALDHQLSKEEIARVFYHLSQRRGFLSNRKSNIKENIGEVKTSITELHKEIVDKQCRTLGELYSKTIPYQHRIRDRYTARDMYTEEFDKIFSKQKEFYPGVFTEEFHKQIYSALFFQRPLKSSRHLVGPCEYEKGSKRCPLYRPSAQRFRILQNINNIRIEDKTSGIRSLSIEERNKLFQTLERVEGMSFTEVKKVLGLPLKGCKINLESGGESRLKGNKTNFELSKVFGEAWYSFENTKAEDALHDINSNLDDKRLKERAMKKWSLGEEAADLFVNANLEEGYSSLSLRALNKILPHMEKGLTYPEAAKIVYGEFHQRTEIMSLLPPVQLSMKNLTNPLVRRCLTEVRHAVNAIIKEYGIPYQIHIELARELRKGRKEREEMFKNMRENEKGRVQAVKWLASNGITNPSRNDITKYLLAEECRWECPYTGKSISFGSLFGNNPEFDIEHIIPLSRCLDDSFANKTLCYNDENRRIKKNKSPHEAYGQQSDKYNTMLERVKKFNGKFMAEKFQRFQVSDMSVFEDFTERMMNDTRYASKLTMEYLSHLYGGLWDENGRKKIFCNSGGVTYIIRRYYGMSKALGGEIKNRDDHRHHAVDACAIALTSDSSIKAISQYAEKGWFYGRTAIKTTAEPWPGFMIELKNNINSIVPIHHLGNKVRGKLHEDSYYGKSEKDGYITIRKKLESLSAKQAENIKDEMIRIKVQKIIKKNDGKEPSKIFSNPENLPFIESKDSIKIPIRSVVIEYKLKTFEVGKDDRLRNVVSDSNHHMEIVAVLDEKGNEIKWEGYPVNMFEAYMRKKNNQDVIRKDFGKGRKFKFSLYPGCMIELTENRLKNIYVLRTYDSNSKQCFYVRTKDARMKKDILKSKEWFSKMPDTLRQSNCRKVSLTPLGEVRYSND